MGHTVTGKLNKAARQSPNQSGVTFFVSIGEKNYDYKTKQNVWTNYEAAIFAKDGQVQFYNDSLTEGAIVSVTGIGLIAFNENEYGIKLHVQDAKLAYVHSAAQPAQQAPQQGYQQQPQQGYQQPQHAQVPPAVAPQQPPQQYNQYQQK